MNTTLILNDELRLSEEVERAVRELSERDGEFEMWGGSTEVCKEMLHQDTDLPDFGETVTICSKVATEFLHAGKLWHAVQLLQYIALLEDKIRSERPIWADNLKEVRMTFGSRERMEILGETLNLHPEIGAEELRKYLNFFDWQALGAVTDLLGDVTSDGSSGSDRMIERGVRFVQVWEGSEAARGIGTTTPTSPGNSRSSPKRPIDRRPRSSLI